MYMMSLGLNSLRSSFYHFFNRLSFLCHFPFGSGIQLVDFMAFVTPVGILNLNVLLECLSIEKC